MWGFYNTGLHIKFACQLQASQTSHRWPTFLWVFVPHFTYNDIFVIFTKCSFLDLSTAILADRCTLFVLNCLSPFEKVRCSTNWPFCHVACVDLYPWSRTFRNLGLPHERSVCWNLSCLKQLWSHTPLRYAIREECTRFARGGLGLELSFNSILLPPIPLAIGKMMPQGGFGDFIIYSLIWLRGCVAQSVGNQKARLEWDLLVFICPNPKV